MRTKQSQANDNHRQKPQEHREATTIKAKSTEAMNPTKTHENQNFQHQKETTRVLHPAPRLTPENGGIPPFLRYLRRNPGFRADIVRLKPIIGDISAVVVWSMHRKTTKDKAIGA